MEELWAKVDGYFADQIVHPDDALGHALAESEAAKLPAISVSPAEGKLLHLIARVRRAKRILEIGTLGGYSAIWMARALPANGRLISLELNEVYAALATKNIARAGLADRVELLVGPAAMTLDTLIHDEAAPFDLVFIDADKANNDVYFNKSLTLTRPGSLIIVDNVVRKGEVVNDASGDKNILGVRRMTELVGRERRVEATVIQTVGSKGYDGFLLALVTG